MMDLSNIKATSPLKDIYKHTEKISFDVLIFFTPNSKNNYFELNMQVL